MDEEAGELDGLGKQRVPALACGAEKAIATTNARPAFTNKPPLIHSKLLLIERPSLVFASLDRSP